ncbi:transcriptional regulator [Acidaminobacter sp. JC074]|uniref:helix-turn-helix transcriptional regulator n=1 Tax=Acidaminobacter sp. JC074 TaxID=2530199 RepID=UPI001F0E3A2C|nr:PAS domain-containing protein [Acidaminobacter sp. JC074]
MGKNKALKKYYLVADLITRAFGKNCEVVIHDLTTPKSSIVYISNGHVTGKEIGETFNILIKQVLLSKNFENDITANYLTTTKDGRRLKSSTLFIRNSKDDVIGAMCINYDISKFEEIGQMMEAFLKVDETLIDSDDEPIDNVLEIADSIIDKIIGKSNPLGMSREEKLDLIRFMDSKGIFHIKGGIDKVADKLHISKVTVYSYLDSIRKE